MNSAFANDVNLGAKRKAHGRQIHPDPRMQPVCGAIVGRQKVQSLEMVSLSLGRADRPRAFKSRGLPAVGNRKAREGGEVPRWQM